MCVGGFEDTSCAIDGLIDGTAYTVTVTVQQRHRCVGGVRPVLAVGSDEVRSDRHRALPRRLAHERLLR